VRDGDEEVRGRPEGGDVLSVILLLEDGVDEEAEEGETDEAGRLRDTLTAPLLLLLTDVIG